MSHYWILGLTLLSLSCTKVDSTLYTDTSQLELPPQMEISKSDKVFIDKNEKVENKGLGDNVFLTEKNGVAVLKIKKTFSRSWNIVREALQVSEIKVTDKNREKGVLYVLYDPDTVDSEGSSFFDSMTFHMFEDDYQEAAYKLTVGWEETDTEITVEQINNEEIDFLDDDGDDFENAVDNGQKLLEKLYTTIRDDLPLK